CPVGANQAKDFALANLKTHIVQGLQAAKAFAQAFGNEQRLAGGDALVGVWQCAHAFVSLPLFNSRLRTAEGHRPSGRKIITVTSATPNSSMRMASGSTTTLPNSVS